MWVFILKMKRTLLTILLMGVMSLGACSKGDNPGSKIKGYTVSFDAHGGTPVETLSNVKRIDESPLTLKGLYTFLGWYETEEYNVRIQFPFIVTEDITLHAKWSDSMDYHDVEIMQVTTPKGTATAYMKASYEDSYLDVRVRVKDNHVYNSYQNQDGSVNGMNDNVELYISPRTDEAVGLIDNETINFLAVPGDKYQAKRFLWSPDYKYSFYYGDPFTDGYEITSRLCNSQDDDFDGYIINFHIPYSLFRCSRNEMFGKTAIYMAMRNTDDEGDRYTQYGESKFLSCELRNTWTHPILNENNELINKTIDTLIFGDSYTDSEFFRNLKHYFKGKNFYGRGISGSKASEWLNTYFDNIIVSQPKDVVIHIGVNDIDDGHDRTGESTFNTISELINKIHEHLPNTNIHWITITDNHFVGIYEEGVNPYLDAYHYVNNHMKSLAETLSFLSVIDYAAKTEGQISLFLTDGLHPNGMGYDMLTDLIYEELGFTRQVGTIFGKAGKLVTSFGYDLSHDNEQVVETNGYNNQYAWVNTESPKSSFSLEAEITALKVNNDDWPKMGLVIKSGEEMIFFFVDMYANLTGKKVGYVYHRNNINEWGSSFDWSTAQTSDDLDINYANGNYVKMSISYNSGQLTLSIDGQQIFSLNNVFDGEPAFCGLLSFNTAFKTRLINII